MFSKLAILVLLQTSCLFQSSQQGLTVQIKDKDNFCLVVPKDYQTKIGDSEYEGGMEVLCQGEKTDGASGTFSRNFWTNVEVAYPKSGVVQMTGCIDVGSSDRLNPNDDGGQYDSNGGDGHRGNPSGSVCAQHPVYVELIEPSSRRACIRCCDNESDCNVSNDQAGCPTVIPGNYFNCGN